MAPNTVWRRKAALLCVLAAGAILKKCRKVRNRRMWTKPWLLNKGRGSYAQICSDLELGGSNDFTKYIRMSPHMYRQLLTKVSPIITKETTNMRETISAGARLEATLQFLTTGCSYSSLQYTSRIARSTLGTIIPETCEAIFQALKDVYLKVCFCVSSIISSMHIIKFH